MCIGVICVGVHDCCTFALCSRITRLTLISPQCVFHRLTYISERRRSFLCFFSLCKIAATGHILDGAREHTAAASPVYGLSTFTHFSTSRCVCLSACDARARTLIETNDRRSKARVCVSVCRGRESSANVTDWHAGVQVGVTFGSGRLFRQPSNLVLAKG